MEVEIIRKLPVVQPIEKIILTMTEREASILRIIVGKSITSSIDGVVENIYSELTCIPEIKYETKRIPRQEAVQIIF